jgi:hypothetical protein
MNEGECRLEWRQESLKKVPEVAGSEAKKAPQPFEQEAEVVAGGGEQHIDLVAFDAFEVIVAEMTFVLVMPDERFNNGPALQFLFNGSRHPALLA